MDWGNTAWAAIAYLGSIGLIYSRGKKPTGSDRILWYLSVGFNNISCFGTDFEFTVIIKESLCNL